MIVNGRTIDDVFICPTCKTKLFPQSLADQHMAWHAERDGAELKPRKLVRFCLQCNEPIYMPKGWKGNVKRCLRCRRVIAASKWRAKQTGKGRINTHRGQPN